MKDKYLIPSAIVAAGVIVAVAVIYTLSPRVNPPADVSSDSAEIDQFSRSHLVNSAVAVGINKKEFESCINNSTYRQAVSDDLTDAANSGGRGTPYSVIINKNGMAFPVNGGALPYNQIKAVVESVFSGDTSNANLQVAQNIKPITSSDHIFGNPAAPLKIVEFSDLECPFCQKFHPTLKQLVNDYNGEVAWVYRHFPLESIHPSARPAAEASECVASLGGNDAFWQYLDLLFG